MTIWRTLSVPALASALLMASPAVAHPRLVATSPAVNSGVGATRRIALTFSERLLAPLSNADVLMIGMPGRPHHPPMRMPGFHTAVAADGKTLMLINSRQLPRGTYRVQWHAVAADTHHVAGAFAFMVK